MRTLLGTWLSTHSVTAHVLHQLDMGHEEKMGTSLQLLAACDGGRRTCKRAREATAPYGLYRYASRGRAWRLDHTKRRRGVRAV